MTICKHRVQTGNLPCDNYIPGGYCKKPYYQCIEHIVAVGPILSHSGMENIDRCPKIWFYDQVLGITMKDRYKGLPLRAGSYLQALLFNPQKASKVYFSQDDWEQAEKKSAEFLVNTMKEYKMLPWGDERTVFEYKVSRKGFIGFLDLIQAETEDGSESFFCEIKFTAKPENFLNPFLSWTQIETYFVVTPEAEACYMLPVRRPQLRQKKSEGLHTFIARIEKDIKKRIKHYFPQYDPSRKFVKWGRKFWKSEVDIELVEAKIEDIEEEIKGKVLRKFFRMRRSQCLWPGECFYFNICKNKGRINWEMYRKKGRPLS